MLRHLMLGFVLAFTALAVPPRPSASAQSPSTQIDLNGIWDVDGGRVLIEHSATELKASFISGGECRPDGYARTEFLDGRPSVDPTSAGINQIFKGTMIVCSGDPATVTECGLDSWYRTDFTIDSIKQNEISGKRFGQWLNDCVPGGRADERDFKLTRNRCAELDREITQKEEQLTPFAERYSTFLPEVITAAHSAAQQRYGPTYNSSDPYTSGPTNILLRPYVEFTKPYANVEDYFINLWEAIKGWERLMEPLAMARDMASETNPIPEVERMAQAMGSLLSSPGGRAPSLNYYYSEALLLQAARAAWAAEACWSGTWR